MATQRRKGSGTEGRGEMDFRKAFIKKEVSDLAPKSA